MGRAAHLSNRYGHVLQRDANESSGRASPGQAKREADNDYADEAPRLVNAGRSLSRRRDRIPDAFRVFHERQVGLGWHSGFIRRATWPSRPGQLIAQPTEEADVSINVAAASLRCFVMRTRLR